MKNIFIILFTPVYKMLDLNIVDANLHRKNMFQSSRNLIFTNLFMTFFMPQITLIHKTFFKCLHNLKLINLLQTCICILCGFFVDNNNGFIASGEKTEL